MYSSVRINVGNGYSVLIGSGLLDTCGKTVSDALGCSRIVIAADSNTAPLYLEKAIKSFSDAHFEVQSFVFPAGEHSKNMNVVTDALEAFSDAHLTRTDCAAALGGGVTGDLIGFAAGCYMRGIKYIQLPTTLLAAVDSSVGGKTAVDLSSGKNLAGLFHQPSLVICDTDCLSTLPDQEYRSGMAEAIKTAVIKGGSLFSAFESGADLNIERIITECVAFKGSIVERDEREQGERKLLNLGHTVAHGIEKCSGYTVPHGKAVSIGMAVIARASAKFGWCNALTAQRIEKTLLQNGLDTNTDISPKQLAYAALSDKKRSGDKITIVVPSEVGNCTLRDINADDLEEIIAAGTDV